MKRVDRAILATAAGGFVPIVLMIFAMLVTADNQPPRQESWLPLIRNETNCTHIIDPVTFRWNDAEPGDVLCISSGTYQTSITTTMSGAADRPIVVKGLGEVAIVGKGVTSRGCAQHITYGINLQADYWTFENIQITGHGAGVLINGVGHAFKGVGIIDNNHGAIRSAHDAGDISFTITDSLLGNTRASTTNSQRPFNECYEPSGVKIASGRLVSFTIANADIIGMAQGVLIDAPTERGTITNTLIYAYGAGIICPQLCHNLFIESSTIYMPSMDTAALVVHIDGNNNVFDDNVIVGTGGLASVDGDIMQAHNCYWNVSGYLAEPIVNPAIDTPPTAVGDLGYIAIAENSNCTGVTR